MENQPRDTEVDDKSRDGNKADANTSGARPIALRYRLQSGNKRREGLDGKNAE